MLQAILDGAQQIAMPAFVSTLCICIVFVPVIFLTGAARYLFTPLALAVVLAMMASYLLSRTLVPTMVTYLLAPRGGPLPGDGESETEQPVRHLLARSTTDFRTASTACATAIAVCWASALGASEGGDRLVLRPQRLACAALHPFIGTDFFPQVDAGQIRLHVRAPAGTRIEETEVCFAQVEDTIRSVIPRAGTRRTSWTTSACPTAASTSR